MTSVSPWPVRFHDRMKLERSSQRIPRAVVLGLLELNCDWLKIPTSQKSFPGSGSQTLFSAETSDSRNYVCVRRLAHIWPYTLKHARRKLKNSPSGQMCSDHPLARRLAITYARGMCLQQGAMSTQNPQTRFNNWAKCPATQSISRLFGTLKSR